MMKLFLCKWLFLTHTHKKKPKKNRKKKKKKKSVRDRVLAFGKGLLLNRGVKRGEFVPVGWHYGEVTQTPIVIFLTLILINYSGVLFQPFFKAD